MSICRKISTSPTKSNYFELFSRPTTISCNNMLGHWVFFNIRQLEKPSHPTKNYPLVQSRTAQTLTSYYSIKLNWVLFTKLQIATQSDPTAYKEIHQNVERAQDNIGVSFQHNTTTHHFLCIGYQKFWPNSNTEETRLIMNKAYLYVIMH